MSNIPWKTIFAIGFIIGFVTVVAAVTFSAGDAGIVSDGVTFGAPDGTNVTLTGETNVIQKTDVLFPSADTVQLKTEAGNVTVQSPGPAWVTVDKANITGTWTNATSIRASNNNLTINPEDKQDILVGGNIDHVAWRSASQIGVDDGTPDFSYGGSVATSTVEFDGVPANTNIAAIDEDTNAILDAATSDGTGTLTYTDLSNSNHVVLLQTSNGGPSVSNPNPDQQTFRFETVTLAVDLSDPDFPNDNVTLYWRVDGTIENTTYATSNGTVQANVTVPDGQHSWNVTAEDGYGNTDTSATSSFTVDHYNPTVSNINPSGSLSSNPTQISADVSDKDFAFDGDTLTVEFFVDGSLESTQTITSNQTVTANMPSSGQTGGSHDILVNVTDDYGQETVGTSSYQVPNDFFVRNETNHSELISADGEIRIFGENQIYTRTAPNGRIDLTGLPVNQDFIVEVEPTESNFTERTVYLQSIYDQQSAYVLNTSAYPTITSRFRLDDPTATFSSQSVLAIQRGINISGNLTFQTVVADRFGTDGVTAELQNDTRYRLRAISDDDNQKVGAYRAIQSETVQVTPGNADVGLNQTEYGIAYGAELNNRTLEYQYVDPQDQTDQLTVFIHERGDNTNLLQPNETEFNLGNYSGQASLSANESQKEWVVEFIINRNGNTSTEEQTVSNQKDLTPPVDQGWQLVLGIALLILFAGAWSVLNAGIGAVVTSIAGGVLWWLGFLGPATSGVAVSMAIALSVLAYMYKGAI